MEGIFRLAPDPSHCAAVERALLKGKPLTAPSASPIVLAHFIKKFVRELPGGLFGDVPTSTLQAFGSGAASEDALLAALSPYAASTLHWLAHALAVTAACESKNKMSMRNLTLVVRAHMHTRNGS